MMSLINNIWTVLDIIERENINLSYKEKNEVEKLKEYSEYDVNYLIYYEKAHERERLSINIDSKELQRHSYGTGCWFGDFNRVLVKEYISEENYKKFIDRIIKIYNTEFKEVENK